MLLVFPLNLYYSYDEEPINHLSLLHIIHEDVKFAAAAAKPLQSCPTLLPHRQQPTRHRGPWDSPGKNTGVGCHFLLQCMKVKSDSEIALSDPMDCSLPGSVHGIFQAWVLEWGAIAFSIGKVRLSPKCSFLTFILVGIPREQWIILWVLPNHILSPWEPRGRKWCFGTIPPSGCLAYDTFICPQLRGLLVIAKAQDAEEINAFGKSS